MKRDLRRGLGVLGLRRKSKRNVKRGLQKQRSQHLKRRKGVEEERKRRIEERPSRSLCRSSFKRHHCRGSHYSRGCPRKRRVGQRGNSQKKGVQEEDCRLLEKRLLKKTSYETLYFMRTLFLMKIGT